MPTDPNGSSEHEFILVLSGVDRLDDATLDALFEAGCDDATPSMRQGRVYLTFARKAKTPAEAILTAIHDVVRAGIGALVVCVDDSNLVSPAGIARRIGRSRQLVSQYISGARGPGDFPPPVCDLTEGHPLWSWREVALWLRRNGLIDAEALRQAQDVDMINTALEIVQQRRMDASRSEEMIAQVFRSVSV